MSGNFKGILAVQARDDFDGEVVKCFEDEDTRQIAMAERAFVTALDGGCSSPVAAYAEIVGDGAELKLTGFYVDEEENQLTKTVIGPLKDGVAMGRQLAHNMKAKLAGKNAQKAL